MNLPYKSQVKCRILKVKRPGLVTSTATSTMARTAGMGTAQWLGPFASGTLRREYRNLLFGIRGGTFRTRQGIATHTA